MIFSLEALKARHGDCLILHYGTRKDPRLILIDGGPARVYRESLKPRLEALRRERSGDGELRLRMLMVSHIDDDHIRGVLDLMAELRARDEDVGGLPYRIETVWHNSFDDLVGKGSERLFTAARERVGAASLAGEEVPGDLAISRPAALVLASVTQGRKLRLEAEALGLGVNQPAAARGEGGLIAARPGAAPVELGDGLSFQVLGPLEHRVEALQKEWDRELRRRKLAVAQRQVLAADYVDRSVFNLASLVVLARFEGRTMLLAGDARGDDILEAARQAGLLADGRLHVDLLKLPHHGSDRNVETDFFRRVTADHYVVSGDGRHGNPEPATIQMLVAARGDEPFTLHMTYPPGELRAGYPTAALRRVLDSARAAGSRFTVRAPEEGALALEVALVGAGGGDEPPPAAAPAGAAPASATPSSSDGGSGAAPQSVPALPRDYMEELIFGHADLRRYTQDSPVLPDVWTAFSAEPNQPVDLLFSPHRRSSAGRLFRVLDERLEEDRRPNREIFDEERQDAEIAYTEFSVVATLYFDEVVRVVLPMTSWWQKYVHNKWDDIFRQVAQNSFDPSGLYQALDDFGRGRHRLKRKPGVARDYEKSEDFEPEFLWMFRIVASLAWARDQREKARTEGRSWTLSVRPRAEEMVRVIGRLMDGLAAMEPGRQNLVWQIQRNRPAELSARSSARAIKADAARHLFDVSCRRLAWAIVDSGIDATHPAFRVADSEPDRPDVRSKAAPKWARRTRVRATYDFTRIRYLLNWRNLEDLDALRRKLFPGGDETDAAGWPFAKESGELEEDLKDLRRHLQRGRRINWGLLEPFLEVPHDEHYSTAKIPDDEHGTHVAGILAARDPGPEDEDPAGVEGICPDIYLYDFRVLGGEGPASEFEVIAALQFIGHMNSHKDYLVVHGANLSVSIRHEVVSFACGRTPVCDEAERLVNSGVVVVAAAGNLGFFEVMTPGGLQESYRPVSITDPGNAEKVITVGATHRFQPHTYGVSYFSSRGPTGDGRLKPDLVAPGEKIKAPVPYGNWRRKDGTSMAAPHVSGAAAVLMARHSELVGRPDRIKKILCDTATDLGRERYFQGAGMLDILRALQSI